MAGSKNQPRKRHFAFLTGNPAAAIAILLALAVIIGPYTSSLAVELKRQTLEHPDTGEIEISVPANYRLDIVNAELRGPRMIEFAPNGDMFIGSGTWVYLLRPPYDRHFNFLFLGHYPHSVAIRGDEMFIASTSALYKTPYNPMLLHISESALELVAKLPGGFGHSSRTVKVGPDGRVFVSIGISGNCSDEMISANYKFSDRRGGILLLDETQTPPRLVPFSSGLRNPVGFDWHPTSKVMYASNNGPDHLGFDSPPEYFSKITQGSFHGMPWYQYDGSRVLRDPCIDSKPPHPVDEVQLPVATFPARIAPLGVAFVPRGAMDENFQYNAIVALHGSWGTQPDGGFSGDRATRRAPAVVMVRFEEDEAQQVVPVISGFQDENGERWARPAGIAVGPDGALYVTSDGGNFHGLLRLKKAGN